MGEDIFMVAKIHAYLVPERKVVRSETFLGT